MNPLLEQFLSESRECLQGIGEELMRLERAPDDAEIMTALFRLVHTLKGNSGLFEFREMTRVLHAGEDLMDAVRNGQVPFSKALADQLLDAMDFVGMLCDEVEASGAVGATHAANSARLAESLRLLLVRAEAEADDIVSLAQGLATAHAPVDDQAIAALSLPAIPDTVRQLAVQRATDGPLFWLEYTPDEECFFQGDDPLHQVRGTPDLLWGQIGTRAPWPPLAEMDAYRCLLVFHALTSAPREELDEYYRYMPEQVRLTQLSANTLAQWRNAAPAPSAARGVERSGHAGAHVSLTSEQEQALQRVVTVQQEVLALPITEPWHKGRLAAVIATLAACARAVGRADALAALDAASASAMQHGDMSALHAWITATLCEPSSSTHTAATHTPPLATPATSNAEPFAATSSASAGTSATISAPIAAPVASPAADQDAKFGKRNEEGTAAPKSLKVDQSKIDRLMNLIGEMVVSKNALPYLAARAEAVFGSRELSREIKAQYAVINRIAEEMQDAIMQVRMMPVSFVFQRFPRLVRDTSRQLGKEVHLVLEGEETEADKNIVEALSDPLIHIVRNSLDHGIELPEVRRAAGKPATGTLTIKATQTADRVIIDIRDDGKGIDPVVIKRKAYQKGLIDEAALERMSDQEAVQLVFAAGFSTMDVVSDLSGRGVGMDVVRTAIEKVNGSVTIESVVGTGTRIRLSLPLSMAVTNVMIIESHKRALGIPMECVVETVRVPREAMHTIKQSLATVLRGKIIPLKSLNSLLQLDAPQRTNGDDEHAVLVVRVGDETIGLIVDDFRETSEVILKPMTGVLAGLSAYAGSALMGDGSVLMVLNVKELL